VVLTKSFYL